MALTHCVIMTPDPNLWSLAGTGMLLVAASVVWLAPVLLAGLVTWISESLRAARRARRFSRRLVPRRVPRGRLAASLGTRRAATSTAP
ncbi:Hypothetical protein I5071_40530 [Sandaracinus amylolyticus]|nr:Hypothetical protein I5071_40530 [Sandaracinus amylolyticus]